MPNSYDRSTRRSVHEATDQRIIAALQRGPLTCLQVTGLCGGDRDKAYGRLCCLRDRGALAGGKKADGYLWRLPGAPGVSPHVGTTATRREVPEFRPLTHTDLFAHRDLAMLTRR